MESMSVKEKFWDEQGTRYQRIQSNEGLYNWLFIPGGPGADSNYFLSLLEKLELPGNVWLIDFPQNGSNRQNSDEHFDFNQWADCMISVVSRFENPIIVGHSFGGMYPLLFPQLESILKGYIVIGSAPVLPNEASQKMIKEKGVSFPTQPSEEFIKNPTSENFTNALLARAPCHFTPEGIQEGREMFRNLPFNYHATLWWVKKSQEIQFNAKWIPQNVPMLVLGGDADCIVPITLFQNDERFKRSNISIKVIENAGHFPWIEQSGDVTGEIENFYLTKIK